jgi:thioredoxin-like negative regulator of GroEL
MSSPISPDRASAHPLSLNRGGRAADWFESNARAVTVAAVAVLVAGGAAAAYRWNGNTKAQRAETALYQAQAAAGPSGDPRQAERALRDVATRYAGTASGTQAQLLLAQSLYDAGRYQDGLTVLQRGNPPAEFNEAVQLLTAAGHEGLGRGADAARIYESIAAGDGVSERRRDELRAAAARAYVLGNDRTSALRLWKQILGAGTGPLKEEARVRVGELAG